MQVQQQKTSSAFVVSGFREYETDNASTATMPSEQRKGGEEGDESLIIHSLYLLSR